MGSFFFFMEGNVFVREVVEGWWVRVLIVVVVVVWGRVKSLGFRLCCLGFSFIIFFFMWFWVSGLVF